MLNKTTVKIVFILVVAFSSQFFVPHIASAKKRTPNPLEPVKEDPNLPRVFLIGDSISIGYTIPAREYLKGIANVQRPNVNCGPTTRGLEHLDQWLGEKPWDVIHFNFGLHDLKYLDKKGKAVADPKKGTQQVPIDQYEKNLEKIVQRLQKTGAILIWRNTTPVPEGASARVSGDAARYNEAALKVMKKYKIPVQDMHAFCLQRLDKIQRPADVHFTEKGSKLLAETVATEIKSQLDAKKAVGK